MEICKEMFERQKIKNQFVFLIFSFNNFRADFTDSVITFSFFEEVYLLLIHS